MALVVSDGFNLKDVQARVRRVTFNGITRTRSDILAEVVKDIHRVTNMNDVLKECDIIRTKLKTLGLFSLVGIEIDTDKGNQLGYDVTFNVREKRRVKCFVGADFGTNEGRAKLNAELPNTFGRAEATGAEVAWGTKDTTYGLYFKKPIRANPSKMFTMRGSNSLVEYPWSGYKGKERDVMFKYEFPTRVGAHSLAWSGTWREIHAASKFMDISIREQLGHSLKSAIRHDLVRDTRDHNFHPTQGYLLQSEVELAGLGGDARYLKNDAVFQYNRSFFKYYVAQVSVAGGCMRSLQGDTPIHPSDRFYLGGPLTMRGFNIKGCGPRANQCSLGGTAYCLGALHLYSPLPFRAGKKGLSDAFRLHAWTSAGNVFHVPHHNIDWQRLGQEVADTMRASCGLGVTMNLNSFIRMELNYCLPFRAQPNDSTKPGWQFGIDVKFL